MSLASLSWAFSSASAANAADSRVADAAKQDDRAAVRALIGAHEDVNAPQVDGTTALHWAAYVDDVELAKMLLDAGAKPAAVNRYGMTVLAQACTNGDGPMVQLLLEHGADPNQALPGGETPLMTASRTGKAAAVRALLAKDAQVEAKEAHGQTAMVWAATEGNVEAAQELIKFGANFKIRLNSGMTPLLLAVREGKMEMVRLLLKAGADVNETLQIPQGGRPGGPKPGRRGQSALHIAVENAHYELAAFLLDSGADPNANGPGYTALHAIPSVRKSGGGDNDPAPDGSGNMTSFELIKKLVAKGADINARMTKKINFGLTSLNDVGATPFCLAALTADAELMRFLAGLGADPKIPTADGATPLIVAAGLGTRSPGEDAGTDSEVVEAIATAIELGNDPNAVDKNGETAMHGAAYKNVADAVRYLASHGANPDVWNQPNKHGWTPLTIAQGYRFGNFKPSPPTVEALLEVMKAQHVPIKEYKKPSTVAEDK
ncbi:MAG TPA: ankyrin repeat domain-containing protein [Bryobacteraceae bacterium]|nr:ankyrin repeat domain-containing protein [Bryobacteraceae bacterium]